MRSFIIFALFISVCVAFSVLREADEQFLSVRKAREANSSSNSSEENDKIEEGSGSGDVLNRVARDVDDASGENPTFETPEESSGDQIESQPVRFVRSVDLEGSGSGNYDN